MVLLVMTLVLFGTASSTYATPIDPAIIMRGGGGSFPIVGTVFENSFPQPPSNPSGCTDTATPDCIDYQNGNPFTFTAIHLSFVDAFGLTYTCDNSADFFFTSCSVAGNVVTFNGMGDYYGGIGSQEHFELAISGLPSGDTTSFTGTADTAASTTPEPASALLFVVAIGAIALFFKRA